MLDNSLVAHDTLQLYAVVMMCADTAALRVLKACTHCSRVATIYLVALICASVYIYIYTIAITVSGSLVLCVRETIRHLRMLQLQIRYLTCTTVKTASRITLHSMLLWLITTMMMNTYNYIV